MRTEPFDPLVRRLALACSRGTLQTSILNELLAGGTVAIHQEQVYMYKTYGPVMSVGWTRIPWASFRALRKRLVEVGFVFEYERKKFGPPTGVKMHFPEQPSA